jgi:hypothetical protein
MTGIATGNYIWVSNNFGASWTSITSTGIQTWKSVTISASGENQTAVADTNYIWVSIDYGKTWSSITSTGPKAWTTVTMVASGQIQLAGVTGEYLYASTDYGGNWAACYSTAKAWSSISTSSSGQNITAVEGGGYIYNCANNQSGGVIVAGSYSTSTIGATTAAGSLYYDITIAGASGLRVSDGSTWRVVKTFVIDHPIDENKYLVHGCLEGPEAGVYYRGKGEITNNECVEIELPDYVSHLATNLTIQISAIYDGSEIKTYNAGFVIDNKFNVYGPNGKFYWIVHGTRKEIEVEPLKENVVVKGDGPYKWI